MSARRVALHSVLLGIAVIGVAALTLLLWEASDPALHAFEEYWGGGADTLRTNPTDPWGNRYHHEWGCFVPSSTYSLGPNRLDESGAGDDVIVMGEGAAWPQLRYRVWSCYRLIALGLACLVGLTYGLAASIPRGRRLGEILRSSTIGLLPLAILAAGLVGLDRSWVHWGRLFPLPLVVPLPVAIAASGYALFVGAIFVFRSCEGAPAGVPVRPIGWNPGGARCV